MKRAALFVGVNRYEDPEINSLSCAESDATELYAFFKHRGGYDDVRHLLSPDSDRFLNTAQDMTAKLGTGDLFVCFFSGHGVEYERQHLLLCPKVRYSRLRYYQHAVSLSLLKSETARAGLHRVFILDACRTDLLRGQKGPTAHGFHGVAGLRDIVASEPVDAGALAILCSCDEAQQSREIEKLGHGVFCLALLGALEAASQKSEAVVISDAFGDRLSAQMTTLSERHGFALHQRPWIQRSGRLPALLERIGVDLDQGSSAEPSSEPEDEIASGDTTSEARVSGVTTSEEMPNQRPDVPADRQKILSRRLDRLHGIATKASFMLGELRRVSTADAVCSWLRDDAHIVVHSGYWYEGVQWWAEEREIRVRCNRFAKAVKNLDQACFSRDDAARSIQNGPEKYGASVREGKTSFYVRCSYLYASVFGSASKAQEAIRRAERSAESVDEIASVVVAMSIWLGMREQATQLWHDAFAKASTTSDLVSLGYAGCSVGSIEASGREILSKAAGLATDISDFAELGKAWIDLVADVERAKAAAETVAAKVKKGEDHRFEIGPLVERFVDAGKPECATALMDAQERAGFDVISLGHSATWRALCWADCFGSNTRGVETLEKALQELERAEHKAKRSKKSAVGSVFGRADVGRALWLLGKQDDATKVFRQATRHLVCDVDRAHLEKAMASCGEDLEDYI